MSDYPGRDYAMEQVGKRYVWDTAGPKTFDCSGLTMMAAEHQGVSLPHNAAAQGALLESAGRLLRATRSSRRRLVPGDIVFYYGEASVPSSFTHCAVFTHRTRYDHGWVVAAVDESHGVMHHREDHFLHATAYGLVSHD